MSVSIEALAMAGADYLEYGMDIEEWEREDLEPPPPHLLAADEEEDEVFFNSRREFRYGIPSFHSPQDLQKPSGDHGDEDEDQITIPYQQPKVDVGSGGNKEKKMAWRVRSLRITMAMIRAVIRLFMSLNIDIRKKFKASTPTSLV